MELDEKIGSVILLADAQEISSDFALALRSGLDNVAVKCAGRTAQMTDPNEIREFILAEINRAVKAAQQILNEGWDDLREGKHSEPADGDDSGDADPDDGDNA